MDAIAAVAIMTIVEKIEIPPSEAIASVRYFPEEKDLEVTFRSRSVYLYYRVPPMIAEGFSDAESAGEYFHDHILDRYDFTRVK